MKRLKTIFILVIAVGLVPSLHSCEDLLDQEPEETGGKLNPNSAIQSAEDLQQLLNSAYDVLANTYDGVIQNPATLLSDNLIRPVNQDDYESVWMRQTTIFNGTVSDAFSQCYIAVLRANTVLYNLEVIGLSDSERNRLEAEARFIRGLCHFEAVRGWAHPYGYSPDNSHPGVAIRNDIIVSSASRATVGEVYNFVLDDITFAKENLPNSNGVYATSWSAKALEAEIRFQMHDYQSAYALADECVSMSPYLFDTEVNKYQFPQASPEALFYIYSATNPLSGSVDNRNGAFRNNYNSEGTPSLRIQPELYSSLIAAGETLPRASLYKEMDQDGNISHVTTMFDPTSFNIPVLTITQMMLIRAESAAEAGLDLTTAIDDINAIRERAYNSPVENLLPSASAEDVIEAARIERRLEFPFNGQRYHDLKRMGSQGENIMVRGVTWDCNGMILQFPATEGTDLFQLNPGGGC